MYKKINRAVANTGAAKMIPNTPATLAPANTPKITTNGCSFK
jgi:hypothetical protein